MTATTVQPAPLTALRWRHPVRDRAAVRHARTCRRLMAAWAFFLPVQVGTSAELRLAVSDLLLVAYLLLRGGRLRRVAQAWSPWTYGLAAVLWGGLVVAVVRTGSVSQTALVAKAVGVLVLLAGVAALVDVCVDWDALAGVLRAFLLGTLLNVALALTAYALLRTTGAELPWVNAPYQASRLTGLLIDPNAFGGLIATALVLHLTTTAAGAPLLSRRAGRLADAVLSVGLLLTFSRSAWIGAVLGLLFVALPLPRVLGRVLGRVLVPLVAGVVLASAWLPSFSDLVSRPGQVTARVSIAGNALHDFLGDPLLGTGLGVFGATHGVIVHNSVLWFLTELGLVGLLAFAGFLLAHALRGLWTLRATRGRARGLALGLFAGVGTGLGVSVGIEAVYQRYWWLMLGGTAAAHGLARRGVAP